VSVPSIGAKSAIKNEEGGAVQKSQARPRVVCQTNTGRCRETWRRRCREFHSMSVQQRAVGWVGASAHSAPYRDLGGYGLYRRGTRRDRKAACQGSVETWKATAPIRHTKSNPVPPSLLFDRTDYISAMSKRQRGTEQVVPSNAGGFPKARDRFSINATRNRLESVQDGCEVCGPVELRTVWPRTEPSEGLRGSILSA